MKPTAPTTAPEMGVAKSQLRTNRPEKILVVDDEQDFRDLISSVLRLNGYDVIVAGNAWQAMDLVRENDNVAFMATDIEMPGMWGDELGSWLQMMRPGVPILYMSGNPSHRGRLSGFPFFDKPFPSLDRFLETIRSLLLESRSFPSPLSNAA